VLYNTAFESVPASDHPRMKGPVDQSKNKQVKDYKGLTAECEEEVYNMLCVVGPALLRAVATARFATAPAASADSPRDPSARRARAVHPPAADCAKVVFLRYHVPCTAVCSTPGIQARVNSGMRGQPARIFFSLGT
jgi:hypothetical protein